MKQYGWHYPFKPYSRDVFGICYWARYWLAYWIIPKNYKEAIQSYNKCFVKVLSEQIGFDA